MSEPHAATTYVAVGDVRALRRNLRRRISVYERRYEMTTDIMRVCVRAGTFPETAEISQWLLADATLTHLDRAGAKSTIGSSSTATS